VTQYPVADDSRAAACLGPYGPAVEAALADVATQQVLPRIWRLDHTVWSPNPREIANRLGWLRCVSPKARLRSVSPKARLRSVEAMRPRVPAMEELTRTVCAAGYTHALLLGMGGSSLSPELFARTFSAEARPHLDLAVLDSTDPGAVLAQTRRLDPAHTLFIVSTKSGGTVETSSLFKFFYNWVAAALGVSGTGEHFIAITDPGSGLAQLAEHYRFRATFLNDPNIGGRYSALSCFGLVPASLVGVDLPRLLGRAADMMAACGADIAAPENPAAWLGTILGEVAKAGRDKVTFVCSPELASFGDWVEQLIAESTGKQGRGLVPVVGEPLGPPTVYGSDRLFVQLCLEGASNTVANIQLDALRASDHPVLRLPWRDVYDVGGQFFLWELATAVCGQRLGINPFDQPNVEAAKALARRMMAEYTTKGALPPDVPMLICEGISVSGGVAAGSLEGALRDFLLQADLGDPATGAGRSYVALQAYVQPTAATDAALLGLRVRLRDRLGLATTVGYGPRFLHSTGQLHKGDAGHGLFIQLTADDAQDAPIPEAAGSTASSISFGVLKAAQSLGDRQALLDAGRRVIRFHLGKDVLRGLQRLAESLSRLSEE